MNKTNKIILNNPTYLVEITDADRERFKKNLEEQGIFMGDLILHLEMLEILREHGIHTYFDYLANEDVVFDKLYAMFCAHNEMPYGTAKARDGDPYEWVAGKVFDFFDVMKSES